MTALTATDRSGDVDPADRDTLVEIVVDYVRQALRHRTSILVTPVFAIASSHPLGPWQRPMDAQTR